MIGIVSSKAENPTKKDMSFIHLNSLKDEDIELEARPYALALARKLNVEKVYLFYGEKGKIIYDCPL